MSAGYKWDFTFLELYGPLLLKGLYGMFFLAATISIAGLVVGVVIGAARASNIKILRLIGTCYVELFRNTPSMVQLLWLFYALPILTGLQVKPFAAAAIGFSLYTGAYMAEIFRSGIQSIEKGQWAAGRALGFSYIQQMRYLIMPQAVRRMLPALTNQLIDVVKLTSIASIIAYPEVVYYAKLIAETEYRPIEAYTSAAVLFSVILIPMAYLSLAIERRLKRSD